MIKLKGILKKLKELKENKDKIDYLNEILKELKDDDSKSEIKKLIEGLEETLEAKLEVELPPVRKITREIDISEVEQDVEQTQRIIRPQPRPDLAIKQENNEEKTFTYTSKNNYATTDLYVPIGVDYQNLRDSLNSDVMKNKLIRENVLNPESSFTDVEKDNLHKKLQESMPGISEEQLFIYESKLISDTKKDEKAKYVARLK